MAKNDTLSVMIKRMIRALASMEIEEKILNAGAIAAVIGVCMPWISGEWLGGSTVSYSGFGYYTGYMGFSVAALYTYVLLTTFVPLSGGPKLVHRQKKELYRCLASIQATILTLASLSVLTKTTLDFARLEIRFGIYLTIIGSLIASLYTFLRYQEQEKQQLHTLFHHPSMQPEEEVQEHISSPMRTNISPPKQAEPEQHKLYASQHRS